MKEFLTRLRPPQLLVLSFGTVILLGTLLLWLPMASVEDPLGFVDALFTATSATCVTGLIVVDTGTHFTLFGQLVILGLIQVGGLGIMTLGTFFIWAIGGNLGWRSRDLVTQTLSGGMRSDLWFLLRNVFWMTLAIEAAGAFLLTGRFMTHMPLPRAVYHAVFHSISAFCNAGFSLNADSLVGYQQDWGVVLTLAALIVAGGLGFTVLLDLRKLVFGRGKPRGPGDRVTFHTRVTLTFTVALIIVGMLLFLGLEWENTLGGLRWPEKMLNALFQSVTPRTAGFNTVPIALASNAALFLMVLLMFIGGAPGSCAGGVKVTTFGVMATLALSRIRGNSDAQIHRRRIPDKVLSEAMGILTLGITVVVVFTFLLVVVETGDASFTQARGEFVRLFFETVSAFGTVGLSAGSTPGLSTVGRLLITLLMFIGRLGPLTMAVAVSARVRKPPFRYPEEELMVG